MEPIDAFGGTGFLRNNREKKKVDKKGAKSLKFSSVFTETSEEAASEEGVSVGDLSGDKDLESLLDKVHETGESLKEGSSLQAVKDYKEAVRGLLAYVVKHTIALEQRESGMSVLKRKRFTLIKIIDGKLERFAAEILSGQREQLEVLRKIDEINGLLVDLMS